VIVHDLGIALVLTVDTEAPTPHEREAAFWLDDQVTVDPEPIAVIIVPDDRFE